MCCGMRGHSKNACTKKLWECRRCGRIGHLESMCLDNEGIADSWVRGRVGDSLKVRCDCCGREGHTKAACWKKNEQCNKCGQRGHLEIMCAKGQ